MSGRRKGLGRGLDALLGTAREGPVDVDTALDKVEGDYRNLPVECLRRGRYQPRRDLDPEALEQLAESIRRQGLMQPLVVRHLAGEDYEIIAGERRWRAAQLAGLQQVPVVVKRVDDETALALALIENIQRENLNAMEEALALTRLQDEFDSTSNRSRARSASRAQRSPT